MATIQLSVKSTLAGVEMVNNFHYWNAAATTNPAVMSELITDFVADVIESLWKEFLPSQYVFTEITARGYDYPYPVTQALSIAGTVTTTLANIKPAYNPLIVKLTVGESLDPETGAVITGGSVVRAGRKFFSGLTDVFEDMNGFVNPGGTDGADLDAFLGALNDDRTGGGYSWEPVILGLPHPPSESSPGRVSPLVAPITGAVPVRFTRLKSRLV